MEIEKMFIYYIEDFLSRDYNGRVYFSFEFIEKNVYLFIKSNNDKVIRKINLNKKITSLEELYKVLYQELKDNYIESETKTIKASETRDLTNLDNPSLVFKIKDIHRNIIEIEFKNHEYVKELLESIKQDWIEIVNSKRMSM